VIGNYKLPNRGGKMKILLISLLALFSLRAHGTDHLAQEYGFLKQSIPSHSARELMLSVGVVGCPFDTRTLRRKIEGEFLRAQIKKNRILPLYRNKDQMAVYLNTEVKCFPIRLSSDKLIGFTVSHRTAFGTTLEVKPSRDSLRVWKGAIFTHPEFAFDAIYGPEVFDDPTQIINRILSGVSDALTLFLKANMTSSD
jgi:hypothetical protein